MQTAKICKNKKNFENPIDFFDNVCYNILVSKKSRCNL